MVKCSRGHKMIVEHGFPPLIDVSNKILILGSFPSRKSREESFFYMHKQNRFYALLSMIFEDDFVNIDTQGKIRLLKKHGIGLYDVIEACEIDGSKDSSIRNVKPTDILSLIKNTKIRHVFLNGRKANDLFLKYNPDLNIPSTYLPSTSPANARYSLEGLYEDWKTIKNHLY